MNCEHAKDQLGRYVDNELPPNGREALESHLARCRACRAEVESLRAMAVELALPLEVPVPDALWTAIERRLSAESGSASPPRHRTWSGSRRAPLALAAAMVLAVGLGMFSIIWTDASAKASVVDFRPMLDGLPLDARAAFNKFLDFYGARPTSPADAKRYAPALNYDLPDVLPGGFHLEAVYLLQFDDRPGVAATYDRDGEFLGTVFHRPVSHENFGPHRDYPCVIGRHKGHQVSVGEWRLVHLMEPTTCHCVLSRLDENTELPAIMDAVAPEVSLSGDRHRTR